MLPCHGMDAEYCDQRSAQGGPACRHRCTPQPMMNRHATGCLFVLCCVRLRVLPLLSALATRAVLQPTMQGFLTEFLADFSHSP